MFIIFALILGLQYASTAPLRLSIDCGSHEMDNKWNYSSRSNPPSNFDVDSLCSIIEKALPKVTDGKFILIEEPTDQSRASNDLAPITLTPPRGFFPNPRIRVPNLKVPRLKPNSLRTSYAPRVGRPMHFPIRTRVRTRGDDSSAERMEKFKKGVQKMLHVVNVLGQIDKYISERTRSIVNVLSKAFAEPESIDEY